MTENCNDKIFPCHKEDLPRLSRAAGQLEGVKKMIEENRYCPDILMQIRAVRSALKGVEANILERHLSNCVAEAMSDPKEHKKKLEELKELFRRYED